MPQNRRTLRRIIKAPSTRTPKNRRRRHCRLGLRALGLRALGLRALGLRARVAPCSCGARDRRASVENAGLPLVLSYRTLFCRFFRRKNMQWKSGRIPFYTLARKKRPDRRGNDAALPCGQGALPVCGGDAVCPAGKSASELARLILVCRGGEQKIRAFCPSKTVWQARRKDGKKEPH